MVLLILLTMPLLLSCVHYGRANDFKKYNDKHPHPHLRSSARPRHLLEPHVTDLLPSPLMKPPLARNPSYFSSTEYRNLVKLREMHAKKEAAKYQQLHQQINHDKNLSGQYSSTTNKKVQLWQSNDGNNWLSKMLIALGQNSMLANNPAVSPEWLKQNFPPTILAPMLFTFTHYPLTLASLHPTKASLQHHSKITPEIRTNPKMKDIHQNSTINSQLITMATSSKAQTTQKLLKPTSLAAQEPVVPPPSVDTGTLNVQVTSSLPSSHHGTSLQTETVLQPPEISEVTEETTIPSDLPSRYFNSNLRVFGLGGLTRILGLAPVTETECTTNEGRLGLCKSSSDCENQGGTVTSTTCSNGAGTCCIWYIRTCGRETTTNRTLWLSPSPAGSTTDALAVQNGGICNLRVTKLSSNICHYRLDLRNFRLKPPTEGNCMEDRMVVSGHNINSFIPKLCGTNSGQQLYVDVDTITGAAELSMQMFNSGFTRQWEIQVSQIECNSIMRPASNCLQYYTGTNGNITSFNYNAGYLNNMNYAACIRKESGFCSIVYRNLPNTGTLPTFQIVNIRSTTNTSSMPTGEAGAGLIQCPNDYLHLAGTRVCGERLNDGSVNPKSTEDAPITDMTNGPFIVKFQTNEDTVGKGFRLFYQQHPC